jgi:cell division protease FtsH
VDLCKVVQHKAGQIRTRKSGGSGGSKDSEQGETITFADVAGIDEAKEELEEIVVCYIGPLH